MFFILCTIFFCLSSNIVSSFGYKYMRVFEFFEDILYNYPNFALLLLTSLLTKKILSFG